MPFVRIDLFEGRTLEQKKALAKRKLWLRKSPKPLSEILAHLSLLSMSLLTTCQKEPTSHKVKCGKNKKTSQQFIVI